MRKPFIVPALTVALSVSIGACEPDQVTDPTEDVAEAPVEFEADVELTSEQIAEARRRVVASLPVDDLGRIDIVDAGVDGTPWYVYVSVGRPAVHEVLDQLDEQGATPAEVFLALAPRDPSLPDVLVHDHDERAARGEASSNGPRRLESVSFRGTANMSSDSRRDGRRDCYSGREVDPLPFAAWIDEFYQWSLGYVDWATHSEDVTKEEYEKYGVAAKHARAMSVCDAAYGSSSNPEVKFAGWTGTHYEPPVIFYIADDLGEFDSARFKSTGGPYVEYYAFVKQDFPLPRRAYVAYGNCDDFCY